MTGCWGHRTNPRLWALSGWFSVHCPWRKPAMWILVLPPKILVSGFKTVDKGVPWVTFSSFAVQVKHMDVSAASQHCFETANWLRTHAISVILYALTHSTTKQKIKKIIVSKSMTQEHKSTNRCCVSSYCLLVKKLLRKYFSCDI